MAAKKKQTPSEIVETISKRPSNSSLVVPEFLEQLMGVWGGPKAFATAFHTEFMQAAKGGVVRARMLSDVLRLYQSNTLAQKGHASTVEGMTDEELKAAVHDLLTTADPP